MVDFQIIDVQMTDTLTEFQGDFRYDRSGESLISAVVSEEYNSVPRTCTVLIFGCTRDGASVLLRVPDYRPELYYSAGNRLLTLKRIAKNARVSTDDLQCETVRRKNMYGWVPNSNENPTGLQEFEYYRVRFPTVASYRHACRDGECHEGFIGLDTKFMDELSIVPSGWARVINFHHCQDRVSNCAIEIECSKRFISHQEESMIAPLLVACVDIECMSSTGAFPDAERDEVCQIGIVFWRVGRPKTEIAQVIFVLGKCAPIDGTDVLSFKTESEMLCAFRTMIAVSVDPDVIATYNGFGFDWKYLCDRAQLLNCEEFFHLERLITRRTRPKIKELSSSALGQNDLFVVNMYGRCNLDMYHWIKAREKLESYKLDSVAEKFLGDRKVEMDYRELFKLAKGSPDEVARVAIYCLQDCALLVGLAIHFQMFPANVEMSRVCHTMIELLVTRGQQVKVVNQLAWHGHRMERRGDGNGGYILQTPVKFSGEATDTYEGATVIDAKAGYYVDEPVAVLDFMSLYPSIIRANNYCFSTLVLDSKYVDLPGVTYETIRVGEKVYTWAKGIPGVIPVMMTALLSARKLAKQLMAQTDDPNEKAVYNARQLALKISANSIYGFTGAVKMGKYHCLGIADSVTFKAREMLNATVEYVQEFTKCNVIYGDTVRHAHPGSLSCKTFQPHVPLLAAF